MGPTVIGAESRGTRRELTTAQVGVALLAVTAGYLAGSLASWQWFGADGVGLAFFPPAGVTLAALVLLPRRAWPLVLAAAALTELAVDLTHGLSPMASLGYAVANTLEPVIGASVLLSRPVVRLAGPRLDRARPMAAFLAGPVVLGPAVAGIVGASVKTFDGGRTLAADWFHWWSGDALGVLVVGGPILALAVLGPPRRRVEAVAALSATVVSTLLFFWVVDTAPAVALLPVLVWAAFRLGVSGVALLAPVIAVGANVATAAGIGVFAQGSVSAQLALSLTQLWVAVVVLTAWWLAIAIHEHTLATQALDAEVAEGDRLRLAADVAQLGVYDVDPSGLRPPSLLNLDATLGLPGGTLRSSSDWERRIHSDDLRRYLVRLHHDLEAGAAGLDTYRIRHLDGRWLRVEDSRRVVRSAGSGATRVIGVVRDVTDRHERAATAARLFEANEQISATRSVEAYLDTLIDATTRAVGADAGAVWQLEQGRLHRVRSVGTWPDGEPAVHPDDPHGPLATAAAGRVAVTATGAGSIQVLAVPLHDDDGPWGVVAFGCGRPIAADLVDALDLPALAGRWSSSLRRVQALDREHRVAHALQDAMLGRPDDTRLVAGWTYLPAQAGMEIGGDWYDVVETPAGTMAVIGDVVGHNLTAATAMGQMRSAARVLAAIGCEPDLLLTHLDRLAGVTADAEFTTMCALLVAPDGRTATYSSAGHPPPVLVRADGGVELLSDARATPVAAFPGTTRRAAHIPLCPGDRIVLYTDGLIERRDRSIDEGITELVAAATATLDLPVTDQVHAIVDALDARSIDDDVAVLIVEIPPPTIGD